MRHLSWEHSVAWSQKLGFSSHKIWKLPPKDVVKMNVDVAIREHFAIATAILRDHQGAICGFKVAKIDVVIPLVGEAEAAKLGVDLAHQEGFSHIILEGDSEVVIKAIQ